MCGFCLFLLVDCLLFCELVYWCWLLTYAGFRWVFFASFAGGFCWLLLRLFIVVFILPCFFIIITLILLGLVGFVLGFCCLV